ncbi:MAG TPA: hypothetical protein VF444_17045 [Pseudonocardiaceae bacterium]
MQRTHLADLLAGDTEVLHLCRSVLLAGAKFEVWDDDTASTQDLASTYARRMRLANRVDQPSIGFAEAVAHLKQWQESELLIGYVDDRPHGGYYFQLFLSSNCEKIIACLGVKPSAGNTSSRMNRHESGSGSAETFA